MSCKPKWILHWLEMRCSVDGNLIVHTQAGFFIIYFFMWIKWIKAVSRRSHIQDQDPQYWSVRVVLRGFGDVTLVWVCSLYSLPSLQHLTSLVALESSCATVACALTLAGGVMETSTVMTSQMRGTAVSAGNWWKCSVSVDEKECLGLLALELGLLWSFVFI